MKFKLPRNRWWWWIMLPAAAVIGLVIDWLVTLPPDAVAGPSIQLQMRKDLLDRSRAGSESAATFRQLAAEQLHDLIKDYPNTLEAKEAVELLKGMNKAKPPLHSDSVPSSYFDGNRIVLPQRDR